MCLGCMCFLAKTGCFWRDPRDSRFLPLQLSKNRHHLSTFYPFALHLLQTCAS